MTDKDVNFVPETPAEYLKRNEREVEAGYQAYQANKKQIDDLKIEEYFARQRLPYTSKEAHESAVELAIALRYNATMETPTQTLHDKLKPHVNALEYVLANRPEQPYRWWPFNGVGAFIEMVETIHERGHSMWANELYNSSLGLTGVEYVYVLSAPFHGPSTLIPAEELH